MKEAQYASAKRKDKHEVRSHNRICRPYLKLVLLTLRLSLSLLARVQTAGKKSPQNRVGHD